MPYKLIVVDASTNLGRFVPLANDAGRVQIGAYYSCLLVFCPGSDRCWPAVQQLSQDYFTDQIETQGTRFFGNGSRQFIPCAIGKTKVTISVSFVLP
jgi:hypothetical protein